MLKQWRAANNMTQAGLAAKVGTTVTSIWRIENGLQTPSPKLAQRLQDETGIPAWEFLRASAAA